MPGFEPRGSTPMTAREELDVEVKRRVMNMSRAELIHTLQVCQVTNIETDDPLCRLHHRKLCDLVSSNAVTSVACVYK